MLLAFQIQVLFGWYVTRPAELLGVLQCHVLLGMLPRRHAKSMCYLVCYRASVLSLYVICCVTESFCLLRVLQFRCITRCITVMMNYMVCYSVGTLNGVTVTACHLVCFSPCVPSLTGCSRLNTYLTQAIINKTLDKTKSDHVNFATLAFISSTREEKVWKSSCIYLSQQFIFFLIICVHKLLF